MRRPQRITRCWSASRKAGRAAAKRSTVSAAVRARSKDSPNRARFGRPVPRIRHTRRAGAVTADLRRPASASLPKREIVNRAEARPCGAPRWAQRPRSESWERSSQPPGLPEKLLRHGCCIFVFVTAMTSPAHPRVEPLSSSAFRRRSARSSFRATDPQRWPSCSCV